MNAFTMTSSVTESSSLLPSEPVNDSQSLTLGFYQSIARSCGFCSKMCLPSKAAIYILFSAAIVGCIYFTLLGTVVAFIVSSSTFLDVPVSVYFSLPYAILALVMMFYPLSGFIADVYCGRYRIIKISLCLLLSFVILVFCVETMGLIKFHSIKFYDHPELFHNPFGICVIIISLVALILFTLGLMGYQANFVQFGLDQLLELPSHYLALFVNYVVWAFELGSLPLMLFPFLWCNSTTTKAIVHHVLCSLPIIVLILVGILLIVIHRRKRWFFNEAGQKNPYRIVFSVIDYARKHKYPLQRSAFTYCDDYVPSRLDFAKERYGGPFTTEQVENVKTFLRILMVLLSIGPVFMLEIPASHFVFPLFSFHIFHYLGTELCLQEHALETIVIGSGNLMFMSTLAIFPLYIWIALRTRFKNLFTRIKIGIVLCLLGVIALLIIDIVGHSLQHAHDQSQCMFQFYMLNTSELVYPDLNMHWSVLIPSNLLLGIGPIMVITAMLEFISAQSPQLMKGFLIGVFFAIRGLFQFLNSIIIIPLSLKHPWASGEMLENPPVTNCGFVYLLFTCVVGGIGFILLLIAAKKYKYRRRDEGMFNQHEVEEIYDRYLKNATINN